MSDNPQVPSSSEKPVHERQGEQAAKEQPKPSVNSDIKEKSSSDDAGGAAPDEEKSADKDPDRRKEMLAIAKGHHGDGNEGPGVKSAEEMKAAAAKKQ